MAAKITKAEDFTKLTFPDPATENQENVINLFRCMCNRKIEVPQSFEMQILKCECGILWGHCIRIKDGVIHRTIQRLPNG